MTLHEYDDIFVPCTIARASANIDQSRIRFPASFRLRYARLHFAAKRMRHPEVLPMR